MNSLNIKKVFIQIILGCSLVTTAFGHCQIPCGIFEDEVQFKLLEEHLTTIAKSMDRVRAESTNESIDYNQLVRWVNNKEAHADKIKTVATDYFLAQRIKPEQEHYEEKLVLLHSIIVGAMKTKQSLDPQIVAQLRADILKFKGLYLGDTTHSHHSD